MSYGRNAYIGANEVTDLVGADLVGAWQQIVGAQPWQQIVGAQPWQQIVGAQTYYPQYYQQPQQQTPWWGGYHHHHHHRHHHHRRPGWPSYLQPQQSLRDHRRAHLYRAYVQGDPVAAGALALMGAEDAQAAQTGVPPADATIPAPPDSAVAPVPPPMAAPVLPPAPMPGPTDMMPPPPPPEMTEHRHRHRHHHRHHGGGGWGGPPPGYGYEIPPRNALIDYPGPSRADRVVLPMSSGVNILPNTSAQITSRPQNVAFRPERLIIGGTPGDWIINDVKVGNRSQFSQSGDVPGEMFAATTIDSFVSFETVQTAMDFVVLVTFVGASESGAPFVCGVLGTAAI